jgi:hypothetical protein
MAALITPGPGNQKQKPHRYARPSRFDEAAAAPVGSASVLTYLINDQPFAHSRPDDGYQVDGKQYVSVVVGNLVFTFGLP